MRIKIGLLVAVLALLSLPALAQNGNSEVSANFTGNFQKQANGFGVIDTATDSGGFLVNYRYHFNRWSAVEANYGNTLFTQVYNSGTVTQARVQEATFAYVFTFGVQAGYRGLIYTAADFSVPTQVTNAKTNMAEPYAGVSFRF